MKLFSKVFPLSLLLAGNLFAQVDEPLTEEVAPVASNTRLLVSLKKEFIDDEIKALKEDFPEEDPKQLEEEGSISYLVALKSSFLMQGALWKQVENNPLSYYVELPTGQTDVKFNDGLRDIVIVEDVPADKDLSNAFTSTISQEEKEKAPGEFQHLLGRPFIEALELVRDHYSSCRVRSIDGHQLVLTADVRNDRIEFEVVNGRVVKAKVE